MMLPKLFLLLLLSLVQTSVMAFTLTGKLLRDSNPKLQTEWATRYQHGEGVSKNINTAIRLYCSAARRNHAEAQYQLGLIYANGRGVRRNEALAAAWFSKAAKNKDRHSKKMLKLLGIKKFPKPQCLLASGKAIPEPAKPKIRSVAFSKPGSWNRNKITHAVKMLAPRFSLDPQLVLALIQVESAFQPHARSHKNAQGLMQLIPATAQRFGVRNPMDPWQNLQGGMAYLRWLLNFFDGDVALALAGYNAGEGAVQRYGGIPPYPETTDYVKKILRRYGKKFHPVSK